ncbi:type I restriction endonuclease subunit R [Paraburkholderia sp. UCT31]|uniref:type I restriction endonuclease subunit R n=1 Tax=Paraburkholderia sp. UCT31 TaxID=2615209 RepID=UPI0016551054|nr:type I restriction endonuclease subunit R [Paraburkholderia sp. UCT31]MBC8737419.1 type I restriction endonuclease subunit R [Paraburkholderia sp. UCT31]
MNEINEDAVEKLALTWFEALGYEVEPGAVISPGGLTPERDTYKQVLLVGRLTDSLKRLNPHLPASAIESVVSVLKRFSSRALVRVNQEAYKLLKDGVPVEYRDKGVLRSDRARLVDFENAANNDWLVVNQLTVQGPGRKRRPDMVVYLNGLPLGVIELKNPADEDTDVWQAFQQLETYKEDIPDLFYFNVLLAISDNVETRIGSLTADRERFMGWRTIDGKELDPLKGSCRSLETTIRGVFEKELFLDYIQNFVLFEQDGAQLIKKIAGYHQFHAVREAHRQIVHASSPGGDGKGGVVWHTQGAGKSIEMVCLAGKVLTDPDMKNPTVVVVTDRNDLDGQLFGTFSEASALLRETPVQVKTRPELRRILTSKKSGGIIFTTIQKFFPGEDEDTLPELCPRSNVVVIVDEAHRSQYGFGGEVASAGMKYGYAKHLRDALPHATYIAFTGTPVSTEDKDTRAVFGEYIHIYDMQQAVEDGATVPLFYEPRMVKLALKDDEVPSLDADVDDLVEDEEESAQADLKSRWTALEKVVGTPSRVAILIADLLDHFKARLEVIEGKALIVGMSREICVKLYDEIVRIHPEWHSADAATGAVKIVMTGKASDSADLRPHLHPPEVKKMLERRFKDPKDLLKLVIVRDMWLTGFDAPCLHTLYVDKPMRGHNLMQAIARVNRVFKDKPGGLVVDYIGIGGDLKNAVTQYTSKGRGTPAADVSKALELAVEKLDVARGILSGYDYSPFRTNGMGVLPGAADHVLGQPDGKKRFADCVLVLTKAYALCSTFSDAKPYREEVAFMQAVRSVLVKHNGADKGLTDQAKEQALKQIISDIVVADSGVVDVFDAVGLKKPNLAVLSDDFLDGVAKMPQKNLAVELLERLLRDDIKSRFATNVVQNKRFSDLLNDTLRRYRSRTVETAQVIEELLAMAKDFNKVADKGRELGLTADEVAFYDALETNEASVRALGPDVLKTIAHELTEKLRNSLSVDWQVRETVRAQIRKNIRTILKRHKYPLDHEARAVETVVLQAEVLSEAWTNEVTA